MKPAKKRKIKAADLFCGAGGSSTGLLRACEVEATVAEGQLALLDIRFRMLQPHELAAAMSFPKSYVFTGNREQKVKQIGNAVPCGIAEALCAAIIAN